MNLRKSTVDKTKSKRNASSAHYVGYVEDEETVEAIMKKFGELEKVKSEVKQTSNNNQPTPHALNKPQEEIGLPEEQLNEVFKRTSAFSLNSTKFSNYSLTDLDNVEELELLEDVSSEEMYEFEQPYTSDDDFEDFKKLEYGRTKSNGNRKAIDKYKYLQYQIQDKQGQSYTIKKKIKKIDPNLPVYVKIPSNPIPLSWGHKILAEFIPKNCEPNPINICVPLINSKVLSPYKNMYAIMSDIPFSDCLCDQAIESNKATFSQFVYSLTRKS